MSDDIDQEPGTAADVTSAADSSGVDPSVVPNVINSLNSFVATQFQGGALRTQMQTQPCSAAGFIREIMTTILSPKLEWRHGWADKAEDFLGVWVRESLQRQGRAGGGLVGGKSLARFMIDAGPSAPFGTALIPPGPRAALIGWLPEAQWLERGHLPTGAQLASGAWRNNMSASAEVRSNGEKLANGIYLYPAAHPLDPERTGSKLRGPGVRSLIEQWIVYQADHVRGANWPGLQWPRPTLTKMVGTYKGTGPFGLWTAADGARLGSRVYSIDLLWADAETLLTEASDRCDDQWELQRQVGEVGLDIQKTQAELDAEERRAKTMRTNAIVIGGLLVGVVAAAGLAK